MTPTLERMARVAAGEPTAYAQRSRKVLTSKQIATIRDGVLKRHRLGVLRETRPVLVRVMVHKALRDRLAVHVTYDDDRERKYDVLWPECAP